jgi:predicted PhzF superfamily epimerase YddE/YHI9
LIRDSKIAVFPRLASSYSAARDGLQTRRLDARDAGAREVELGNEAAQMLKKMHQMRIPYFQVNAFTSEPFAGNPAGVCLLEQWLPDALLQRIAAENNLSETAFLVRRDGFYDLRWMTPTAEVDLCGHATLASAFVLLFEMGLPQERVVFQTLSGRLSACRLRDFLELDFPSRPPQKCSPPDELVKGLGRVPVEVLKSRDYLAVYNSATEVAALQPDMGLLAGLDCLGVIVTAPGIDTDFVSRFFAPKVGVPEDPVTGSAHCSLIPYWSARLGKSEMVARQISKRGGELFCRMPGERVGIGGRAMTYFRGELEVS